MFPSILVHGCCFHSFYLFIYLFIFGCIGSLLLGSGFLLLQRAGAIHCCSTWASHCGGFSCCGALGSRRAGFSSCGTRAQQLWCTGLAALRHVGSSRTKTRTRVPCIGRLILNHCTTREALHSFKSRFLGFWGRFCFLFFFSLRFF